MKPWILGVALAVTGVETYVLAQWQRALRAGSSETGSAGAAAPARAGSSMRLGDETQAHLEAVFRADHPVAASRELAQRLANGVRAVLPAGSMLRNVECRSMLCRIETAHASPDEFIDFVDHAFLGNGVPVTRDPVYAGVIAEPRAGEPMVAVAYVGRDKSALAIAGQRDP
jgi:hypothetical protein